MWIAMDKSGWWYEYNELPVLNLSSACWDRRSGDPVILKRLSKLPPSMDTPWTDTLNRVEQQQQVTKTKRDIILEKLKFFTDRELQRALDIINLESIL